jgi:hypothetical protein
MITLGSNAKEKAFIGKDSSYNMTKKGSAILVVIILALGMLYLFADRILPAGLLNEWNIEIETIRMGFLGGIILLVIILIVLALKTRSGKKKVKKEKLEKHGREKRKEVKEEVKKEDTKKEGNLKKKREELVNELKEAEKQFLKNKIDKKTFDKISTEKNSELVKIEADLDSEKMNDLDMVEQKRLDSVSEDKKKVLKDLLEQKQRKVHELRVAEKSYYKRKINEKTFKKINSEVKEEIISIESKIKSIQKSEAIEELKKELLKGAKEVSKQKKKTEKRKSENEIFEDEVFEQIDDMVGGLKR